MLAVLVIFYSMMQELCCERKEVYTISAFDSLL